MNINGINVLITGGFGALGKSIAESLKLLGANVYVFDLVEIDEPGCFCVDVCDETEVKASLDAIDRIDVLINCAGEIYSETCVNMLKNEFHQRCSWDRVVNNNLTSCFNMSIQVANKMVHERVKGVIINFSSISARGNAGQIAYSASKAGIEAMTVTMAKELGLFKIRCVAIAPGFIDTPSTHNALTESTIDMYRKSTPLRMLGKPEHIVKTIEYIIECDYLNGCVIPVDGALQL